MAIDNARSLFLHELATMYAAERQLVQTLGELAEEIGERVVSTAFRSHQGETRRQRENLEKCFRILAVQPPDVQCAAIEGLRADHDHFLTLDPSADALTMFDLLGAAKIEHFEIASYRGLVRQAAALGEITVASLLRENLRQEEVAADTMERLAEQLGRVLEARRSERATEPRSADSWLIAPSLADTAVDNPIFLDRVVPETDIVEGVPSDERARERQPDAGTTDVGTHVPPPTDPRTSDRSLP